MRRFQGSGRVAAILCASFLAVSLSASADEGAERRRAFRLAQEPLRDRDWAKAAERLRQARDDLALQRLVVVAVDQTAGAG